MRLTLGRRIALLALILMGLTSCAPAIARYPWTTDDAAIAELRRRSAIMRTVEASCSITLRDDSRSHVTLDGALVARNPTELRLRAWKLQHPAFDITAVANEIWIDAPSQDRDTNPAILAKNIREAWSIINGEFLHRDLMIDHTRSALNTLVLIETKSAGDLARTCVVDRKALTPLRYEAIASDGRIQYVIRLEKYRRFGEILWPRRIVLEHGVRRLTIDVQDIEFNAELNPLAFKPPKRAVRLP